MTLGEFRELTHDLPDDYELVASPGDATFWETWAHYDAVLPSTDAYTGVVILSEGQEITEDYWIPARLGLDD